MVEAGETVQVTRHGKPILRIVPEPTPHDPLAALSAAGLLTPAATSEPLPVGAPVLPIDQIDELLDALRADADA